MSLRYLTKLLSYMNTRLIFAQSLRTISASTEEQSLKFSIEVVKKTAASDTQFAKWHFASCLFMHN